ncbi:(2Fe-2S)-binding protein [Xanthobacter sp. TB0136]|uniref:(2Fe-2S)-binding protein n=1 Tax=Xanthobacter sp. TB0136 TaxID=3459177 RepID=UPI00403A2F8E
MIVCSCNVFSDHQVRDVVSGAGNACSTSDVYRGLGCAPQCGRCARTIRNIMEEVRAHEGCRTCTENCVAAGMVHMLAAE